MRFKLSSGYRTIFGQVSLSYADSWIGRIETSELSERPKQSGLFFASSKNVWNLITGLLPWVQTPAAANTLRATWQRLRRTCSQVKWEHGEQRRVWHLASASTLPRSYYCSKVLLKKHSPTVGNFPPFLKTEMMSGGGMIRRGQDQVHNWRYPALDQSHSLTRCFLFSGFLHQRQKYFAIKLWNPRGDLFQMNLLIRLTDMLIKCYDAQIYGILSYQLAALAWGCDWILLKFQALCCQHSWNSNQALHLFLISISPRHRHIQK